MGPETKQEEVKEVLQEEPVASIVIEKHKDGRIGVSSVNDKREPLSFNEQREILHRVLDLVNDNLMAAFVGRYVDNLVVSRKINLPGFRGKSLGEFLVK